MGGSDPVARFRAGKAAVEIFEDSSALAAAAASKAAELIRTAIGERGRARILVATGNSQLEFIAALVEAPAIRWSAVEAFHLDEYAGLAATHPASFRRWVKTHFADRVHPGALHLLEGDAIELGAELKRYSALLDSAAIDVAFVGIGENGHIAFNDPHSADFGDPLTVKVVTLDEACRRQQAGEGHFPDAASVPDQAVTVTCPALMRTAHWVSAVPEGRKAEAVRNSLEGPISARCPGSLVRLHPGAFVYLDRDSASRLARLAG
jgi:glucosamine-6-phosphate deaminase